MSDPEEKKSAAFPRAQSSDDIAPTTTSTIEQARKFLDHDEVRNASRARKAEFLKSKGIDAADIEKLLAEAIKVRRSRSFGYSHMGADGQIQTESKETAHDSRTDSQGSDAPMPGKKQDRPPIVTYPEFLAKPARPPPLVTVNGVRNALYALGGLSTIIYGASKYFLAPMADSLTEARIALHDTAQKNLTRLNEKLENTVSEIPACRQTEKPASPGEEEDSDSTYDDPTELFHRDIGVQTSLPSSPLPAPSPVAQAIERPSIQQARRLRELIALAKSVSDGFISQSEDYADVATLLDVFKDDLDQLTYQASTDFVGSYSLYGTSMRNEPDDEIKTVKENIRKVKGALLNARSFPASVK
jgi:hypothetical protein